MLHPGLGDAGSPWHGMACTYRDRRLHIGELAAWGCAGAVDGPAILRLAQRRAATMDAAACLESCRSAGAVAALELGPGTALSRMASPLFSDGRARTLDEFRTLAGLKSWLQRAIDSLILS